MTYERSRAAMHDWEQIVEYTLYNHGLTYMAGLLQCITVMLQTEGDYKELEIEGRILRVKHCQKHYIFGLVKPDSTLMIIAFFHERMDFIKRLKDRF